MIKTHLFSIFDFIDFQEMAVAASSANEDRAAMVRQKEEIRSLKEEKERNAQLEMKRVGLCNDCSVVSICSMRSQYMYNRLLTERVFFFLFLCQNIQGRRNDDSVSGRFRIIVEGGKGGIRGNGGGGRG